MRARPWSASSSRKTRGADVIFGEDPLTFSSSFSYIWNYENS